jgi:hypothetical protein
MTMEVNLKKAEGMALAFVDAVLQLSDRAEALGGATSIAGVAALNTMQKSIQTNGKKIVKAIKEAQS